MIRIKRIYNTGLGEREIRKALEEQYLQDPLSLLGMDASGFADVKTQIEEFYRNHLDSSGTDGYVIGLSGGIDSSLVATLAVEAVGAENVYGVIIPSRYSTEEDISIAVELAERLGIETNDHLLTQSVFDPILNLMIRAGEVNPDQDIQRIKEGNIQARMRMIILRDIAKNRNSLVLGTTNQSEELMGYFTIGGDGVGGVDNEGISGLHKTTEKIFARYIGLDEKIISKAPSAGLWEGQRDEDELGISYENLDQILAGLQLYLDMDQIVEAIGRDEVGAEDVKKVIAHVERNRYKRTGVSKPFFF